MLYETCARAEEILTLDIEDLLPDDKRGRVISKGGATDWVHSIVPVNEVPGSTETTCL
jgi:integrase/recombinase XerD